MKKQMKGILYTLIILSLVVSALIGNTRIQKENNYNEVQIAIHYNHVLDIARQTNQTIEQVLEKYKALGANVLFVRENTVMSAGQSDLGNLEVQGKAFVREGYDLQFIYPEETQIKGQYHYVKAIDLETTNKIYENLTQKGTAVYEVTINEELFLEVRGSITPLVTTGVGFNDEDMETASRLGYTISPQIKGWTKPTDESIEYVVQQIRDIPSLGTIYFSDIEIPGYTHEDMIALVEEYGIGYVEFFSSTQKGFQTLAKNASQEGEDYHVVRLHTLGDADVKNYTQRELLDRYSLGLRERNLRAFLFKMPNTLNIVEDEKYLEEAITNFVTFLEETEFELANQITPLNLGSSDFIRTLIVGIASILVFILLVDYIGFTRTGYILGILGLIGYAGLLKLSPSLGVKMMALFGSIIFPTYGIVVSLDTILGSYKRTLIAFAKMTLIAFGGALTVVGTLSTTTYALGMDIFSGVKVAQLIPIGLVVVILYYKRHGLNIEYYKKLLLTNINYLALALLGIGGVVFLIYTSRTGNSGTISELELMFRQLLDTILGVRPRTKEFLIGHPAMLVLLYFGYQEKYLPLLILGIIGQVSIVNTYAHLHTPITISLIRSAYGIIFGVVIGLCLIVAIKIIGKVINQWIIKKQ